MMTLAARMPYDMMINVKIGQHYLRVRVVYFAR
jgi:hypothetical protein